MKKLLIGLTSIMLATGAIAQSKVNFSNALGGTPTPVVLGDGTAAGADYTADLSYNGASVGSGALLGSGFFSLGEVALPGADGSGAVDLVVTVYKTSLGAVPGASVLAADDGFRANISITPTAPPVSGPPSPAVGLAGAINAAGWEAIPVVPEPSVIALALLGAGAVVARRRRA